MSASTSTSAEVVAKSEVQEVKLLTAVNDRYGGVIVDINEPMDCGIFASILRASLLQWRHQGKRGVWIKFPIQLVNLVESAVKEGFWFHHAEPNYLMLVYWIPEGVHTLPANASHRIGIGAFVMNEKREVLVVQENKGRFWGTGFWKFPTGVVNEGEDICVTAVREVKEETAIDTEFIEVLAFRQSHKMFFGKSDILFLCMLRPLSFDIHEQKSEIEAAQWMPWKEYAAQPLVQENELWKYTVDVCLAKKDEDYSGFTPVPIALSFYDKNSCMYLNNRDLNRQ